MKEFKYLSVPVQAHGIDLKPTADVIEGCCNKYAAQGWRLHHVVMVGPGCAICIFESETDVIRNFLNPGTQPAEPHILRPGETLLNKPAEGGERPVMTTR